MCGVCEDAGICGSGEGAHEHHGEAASALPRAVEGDAVDPIALEPVDELVVTMLVDNSYDGLMVDTGPARRATMGKTPPRAGATVRAGRDRAGARR